MATYTLVNVMVSEHVPVCCSSTTFTVKHQDTSWNALSQPS